MGPRDAIYRNYTVFCDAGDYQITPVGNRVIVTDPAGTKHEIANYVGEFEPLRMA
jgi:hypothetical protein